MFKFVFIAATALIVTGWIVMGVVLTKLAGAVEDKGIKGGAEQLWCGKDVKCTLEEKK